MGVNSFKHRASRSSLYLQTRLGKQTKEKWVPNLGSKGGRKLKSLFNQLSNTAKSVSSNEQPWPWETCSEQIWHSLCLATVTVLFHVLWTQMCSGPPSLNRQWAPQNALGFPGLLPSLEYLGKGRSCNAEGCFHPLSPCLPKLLPDIHCKQIQTGFMFWNLETIWSQNQDQKTMVMHRHSIKCQLVFENRSPGNFQLKMVYWT